MHTISVSDSIIQIHSSVTDDHAQTEYQVGDSLLGIHQYSGIHLRF